MNTWIKILGLALLVVIIPAMATYPQTAATRPSIESSPCSEKFIPIGAALECQADEFSAAGWKFTVTPELPCKGDDIAVAFQSWGGRNGLPEHWIAKKFERTCQLKVSVSWADSRSCSGLIVGLKNIGAIGKLQLLAPGFDQRSFTSVLDGALFTVQAPIGYLAEHALGEATLSGNVDSPVGKWVKQELESLNRCWSATKPAIP